jgi:membrane protease YdiL (CAAX protease family)
MRIIVDESQPPPFAEQEIVQARPVAALSYAAIPPPRPSPLELPGLRRADALVDLALIALVTLIVPFGLQLVLTPMAGVTQLEPDMMPLLTVQKWFDAVLAGGVLAYLVLRHRLPAASFGLRVDLPFHQALWVFGGLCATYGWMLVTVVVILPLIGAVPSLGSDLEERLRLLDAMPISDLGSTIALLIPVAIHEEIIFRGLLLPYLRKVTGHWWVAVVVSGTLFATLHYVQGWLGVAQIAGVALVFSLVFIRSRSLLVVIVAHFAFDFLQFQIIRFIR